ncbi:hypothetical protein MW887_002512 [Aspergillus wentii]|nr:hypothetical protein MW887_002512 [Aspergillus wentii]
MGSDNVQRATNALAHLASQDFAGGKRRLFDYEIEMLENNYKIIAESQRFKERLLHSLRVALKNESYEVALCLLGGALPDDFFTSEPDILPWTLSGDVAEAEYNLEEDKDMISVVKQLVSCGAQINARDDTGRTALYYACCHGYLEIFHYLMDVGADYSTVHQCDRRCDLNNDRGEVSSTGAGAEQSLLQVVLSPYISMVDPMWDYDSRSGRRAYMKRRVPIITRLLDTGLPVDCRNRDLIPFLYVLCYEGDEHSVDKLLDIGIDVNIAETCTIYQRDRVGSALHAAIAGGHASMVELLIRHNVNVHSQCYFESHWVGNVTGSFTSSTLLCKLKEGRYSSHIEFRQICELLLVAGVNDDDRNALLAASVILGQMDLAERLLQEGSRVDEVPISDNPEAVEMILQESPSTQSLKMCDYALGHGRKFIENNFLACRVILGYGKDSPRAKKCIQSLPSSSSYAGLRKIRRKAAEARYAASKEQQTASQYTYPSPRGVENEKDMEPLVYTDLSGFDSIRLLELEPSESPQDPIRCHMVQDDLSQKPDYDAISYAWGNTTRKITISVNDCRLGVTMNLWSALFRLRRKEERRRLWVDAICINQENIQERNQQFTESAIQKYSTIEIFHWFGPRKGPGGLCSWVPDYGLSGVAGTLPWPLRDGRRKCRRKPQFRFREEDLIIKGRHLGLVKEISCELVPDGQHIPGSEGFTRVLYEWESLAAKVKYNTCWKTTGTLAASVFASWYDVYGTGVVGQADPDNFNATRLASMSNVMADTEEKVDDYAGLMEPVCYGRRFFITNNSMGLAPPRAQPGDQIVYLSTGRYPFILRVCGEENYEMIGDCFLEEFDLEKPIDWEHDPDVKEFTIR